MSYFIFCKPQDRSCRLPVVPVVALPTVQKARYICVSYFMPPSRLNHYRFVTGRVSSVRFIQDDFVKIKLFLEDGNYATLPLLLDTYYRDWSNIVRIGNVSVYLLYLSIFSDEKRFYYKPYKSQPLQNLNFFADTYYLNTGIFVVPLLPFHASISK